MTTKINLNGTTRKALVTAIAEITGEKAIYRAMPLMRVLPGEFICRKWGGVYPCIFGYSGCRIANFMLDFTCGRSSNLSFSVWLSTQGGTT